MPTLDWLNRASAFTTAARVPYRLLEQVSLHTPTVQAALAPVQAELLTVRPEPVAGHTPITDNLLIQGDNLEALKSEGEEFECAKALDREDAVKHWVRNLEQLPEFAFWLPTATDYFYPDFVAELNDGRLLVVEYKGDGYATNDDSREKRLVGQRWAQTTGQRFVMVEKMLNGMDMATQIRAAVKS